MNLGEKIKAARLEKHMTQSEVASDKITRNMLSAIESGKATPSLDTLLYISKKLDVPVYYLVSDDVDVTEFKKKSLMPTIKEAYSKKQYEGCIFYADKMDYIDDEVAYMLTYSHFALGVAALKNGSFITADKHLTSAEGYATQTIYDTTGVSCKIPLYRTICRNVNSPLLDFDKDTFLSSVLENADFEFFKYVCNDWDYQYTTPLLRKYAKAKIKIRERRYYEALNILLEIAGEKNSAEYNAYFMYCVYGDLENCYKQILDFENAYKYVSKRMSMIDGFNS